MKFKNTVLVLTLLAAVIFVTSCGNSDKETQGTAVTDSKMTGEPAVSAKIMDRGLVVYKTHCFACHQMTGSGIKGIYPPLAENKTVIGEKTHLIRILLYGMSGPIEVNGEKYNQVMVPHNFLSDEQIADVLTFVRNSFGNEAAEVEAGEVKSVRKANR